MNGVDGFSSAVQANNAYEKAVDADNANAAAKAAAQKENDAVGAVTMLPAVTVTATKGEDLGAAGAKAIQEQIPEELDFNTVNSPNYDDLKSVEFIIAGGSATQPFPTGHFLSGTISDDGSTEYLDYGADWETTAVVASPAHANLQTQDLDSLEAWIARQPYDMYALPVPMSLVREYNSLVSGIKTH